MEKEKNIMKMENYYLMVNIQREIKMEEEKNFMKTETLNLLEII